jgi:hypothetical protein
MTGSYVLIGSTETRSAFNKLSRHSAKLLVESLSSLKSADVYPDLRIS